MSRRRGYLATSAIVLGGIVLALGVVMAAQVPGDDGDRLLIAHLLLGAYGCIGVTVLGALVRLWPTVLHARVRDNVDTTTKRALPLLLVGLVIAAVGPLIGVRPLVAVGMVLWIGGAALIGLEGVRQARTRPPATFAGYSLAAAYGWLVVAAAALVVQALVAESWAALREGHLMMLAPFVAGFAVQIVAGALSFRLPVVVMGSPAAEKAGAEALDRGAVFRVVTFNGAIALFLIPLPSVAHILLAAVVAGLIAAFIVMTIRAVVAGRRLRERESPTSDPRTSGSLGTPSVEKPRPPRRPLKQIAAAFTVLALCVAGGVAADPGAVGIPTTTSHEVVPTGETTEVTVRVTGMLFTPAVIEVPVGDELVVTFENTGTDVHDLVFANGVSTDRLAPGASETVEVGVMGADMDGWCSVSGHRQMGMELRVDVTGIPEGS